MYIVVIPDVNKNATFLGVLLPSQELINAKKKPLHSSQTFTAELLYVYEVF